MRASKRRSKRAFTTQSPTRSPSTPTASSADIGQSGNGALGFLISAGGGAVMIAGFVVVIVWGVIGHPDVGPSHVSIGPNGIGLRF